MTLTQTIFTAEDLRNLPDDGARHELVKGELQTMPLAGPEHGAIAAKILIRIGIFAESRQLGCVFAAETGFRIEQSPDTVRGADAAFVAAARMPEGGIPAKYFPFAPDLAVEVLSPSDTVDNVEEKIQGWLDGGARLVWLVKPRRRSVVVHAPGREPRTLQENDQISGEDVVPGFTCTVREFFPA